MTTCPKCRSRRYPGDNECRKCGVIFAKINGQVAVDKKEDARKFKPSCITIVGGGFIGLCLLIAILSELFGMRKVGGASPPADLHNMAYTQCQYFVSKELKAPASADFPFFDFKHHEAPDNVYIIHAYVDAQNSYGAKVRSDWRCKVQYAGGDNADPASWKLLEVRIY